MSGEPTNEPAPPSSGTSSGPPSRTADVAATLYPDDVPATDDSLVPPPEQKAEEKAEQKQEAAPQTAPNDYQLKMPDGVQMDVGLLNTAAPLLREAGISQAQAQKLVPIVTEVQQRMYQQNIDEFAVMRRDWVKTAMTDAEIGGPKWKETTRLCRVALDAAGVRPDGEFRKLMNDSGLGDHPAVLRVFRFFGQHFDQQRLKSTPPAALSREERLYPND